MNSLTKKQKKLLSFLERNSNNFFIMQPLEYKIQIVNESLQRGVNLQIQKYCGEFSYDIVSFLSLDEKFESFSGLEEDEEHEISAMIEFLSKNQESISQILAKPGYQVIIHERKEIPLH